MFDEYFTVDLSDRRMVEVYEILLWCKEQYGDSREGRRWGWDPPLLVFVREQDLLLFQLKWL